MKILAFTDVHGKMAYLESVKEKAAESDLIICCGDLTIFEDRLDQLLTRVNSMNKLVFMLQGNHEGEGRLRDFCKKFKNIFFLHKEIVEHGDLVFIGFGGGGFAQVEPDFEYFIKKNQDKLKNKKIILVTHGPAYNTRIDVVVREHVGNKSYRDFIKKYQPLIHFCGHLHENFQKVDKIGQTLTINPGPEGRIIDISDYK
jgi:uncharacterized protein